MEEEEAMTKEEKASLGSDLKEEAAVSRRRRKWRQAMITWRRRREMKNIRNRGRNESDEIKEKKKYIINLGEKCIDMKKMMLNRRLYRMNHKLIHYLV